jgi:hypothetical protein
VVSLSRFEESDELFVRDGANLEPLIQQLGLRVIVIVDDVLPDLRGSNHVAASTASRVDWWKRALRSKAAS